MTRCPRIYLAPLAAFLLVAPQAYAETTCEEIVDIRRDADLENRLKRLTKRAACLRGDGGRSLLTSPLEVAALRPATAAVSEQEAEIVLTQMEQRNVESKIDFQSELGLGVGIGYSWGRGTDRVADAQIINGVVRIRKSNADKSRIFLEAHKFLWTMRDGDIGFGPFVSTQSGSDDALSSWGIGLMAGIRDPATDSDQTRSWNLGVGYLWDSDVQTLGEGIVANQPLPIGETEIRYKNRSMGSLFAVFSRKF